MVRELSVGGTDDVTVKPENTLEVPSVLTTKKVRRPAGAPGATVISTGRVFAVPPVPMVADTPLPEKTTDEAPCKLKPEMLPETVPTPAAVGLMPVICGPPWLTVKPENAFEVPTVVVTVNVLKPGAAFDAIETVMGRLVAVPPLPT